MRFFNSFFAIILTFKLRVGVYRILCDMDDRYAFR